MVAQCYAQSGRDDQEKKEADLKGVQSKVPDVGGDGKESGQERSDQKRAIYPVNFFPREVHLTIVVWPGAMKRPAVEKSVCART